MYEVFANTEFEDSVDDAARFVLSEAHRVGGVSGIVVPEDAIHRLARILVFEFGVQVGREIGDD